MFGLDPLRCQTRDGVQDEIGTPANAVLEGTMPARSDRIVLPNVDPPSAERVARIVRIELGWLDDNFQP